MFHFSGNPTCSERTSDADARVSVAPDLKTFRDCQIVNARYCAECAGIRSDSDRYAELRKLVEDCQREAMDSASPVVMFDNALRLVLDWRHR